MGPYIASPLARGFAFVPYAQYWRSRRGLTVIACILFAFFFLANPFGPPPRQPVSSAFGGSSTPPGGSNPRAAGSFGGWRGWQASWGRGGIREAGVKHAEALPDHPASPIPSGLSDFKKNRPQKSLSEEELERKKKAESEEAREKEKGEEDEARKEENERLKKEQEEEAKRLKEEAQMVTTEEESNNGDDAEDEITNEDADNEAAASITLDDEASGTGDRDSSSPDGLTTTIVVGRLKDKPDAVKWITDLLKGITHRKIYIVDDPEAPLHLDKNKGREAMVYLTYILDHYDNLDDVTFFFHSDRDAWHNNAVLKRDAAVMVNNLNREWVIEKGYVNARCELYPGCPQWIKWNATAAEAKQHAERTPDLFSAELWDRLFPNRTHDPHFLSQPCCSQFAASREMIRSISRTQYQTIRDWLATTKTFDGFTGRIMEYTWQFLFLNKDEHCPDMQECYCKGYGVCLKGEQLGTLNTYNRLRGDVDDTLDKLAKWDIDNGCNKMVDKSAEKQQCKASNPWIVPLDKVRHKKQDLERTMPKDFGITEP